MENFIVISAFLSFALFIFPVFVTVSVILSGDKAGFSVYAFSFIKIVGGYVTLHRQGYCVHFSEKKAIFVEYNKMNEERKKFAVTEGFQLYKLHLTAELNKSADYAIPLTVFLQSSLREAFAIANGKKGYLSLKSGVFLSDGKACLTVKTATVFNFFVIVRAAVKIIMGRIITKIWKEKQKIPN